MLHNAISGTMPVLSCSEQVKGEKKESIHQLAWCYCVIIRPIIMQKFQLYVKQVKVGTFPKMIHICDIWDDFVTTVGVHMDSYVIHLN